MLLALCTGALNPVPAPSLYNFTATLGPQLEYLHPGQAALPANGTVLALPEHCIVSYRSLLGGVGPTGLPALGSVEAPPLLSAALAQQSWARVQGLWALFPPASNAAACGGGRQQPLCTVGSSSFWSSNSDLWLLAVWLLRERALAALGSSAWGPYLASLPRSTPRLPFLWSQAELELLQDPGAAKLAAHTRSDVRAAYAGLLNSSILPALRELAAPVLAAAAITLEAGVSQPSSSMPWPMVAVQMPSNSGPPPEALRQASKQSHANLLFEANAAWVAAELNLSTTITRRALAHDASHHSRARHSSSSSSSSSKSMRPFLGGALNEGFRLSSSSGASDSPELVLECGGDAAGGGLPAFQCSHDSLASFTWALTTVLTHAVMVEGRLALVPGVGGGPSSASYSSGAMGLRLSSSSSGNGTATTVTVKAAGSSSSSSSAGEAVLLDLFPIDSSHTSFMAPDVHSHAHYLPLGGYAGSNLSLGRPVTFAPHTAAHQLPLMPREPQASATCWRLRLPELSDPSLTLHQHWPAAAAGAAQPPLLPTALAHFSNPPQGAAAAPLAHPPSPANQRTRRAIAAALGLSHDAAASAACSGPAAATTTASSAKALQWLALTHLSSSQAKQCAQQLGLQPDAPLRHAASGAAAPPPCSALLEAVLAPLQRARLLAAAHEHTLFSPPLNATSYAEDLALLAALSAFRALPPAAPLPVPSRGTTDRQALQQALVAWGEGAEAASAGAGAGAGAVLTPTHPAWWEEFACPTPTTHTLAALAVLVLNSTHTAAGTGTGAGAGTGTGAGTASPTLLAANRLQALLHSTGLLPLCASLFHERRQLRQASASQRRRSSPLHPGHTPPAAAALSAAAAAVAHRALHKGVLWSSLLQLRESMRALQPEADGGEEEERGGSSSSSSSSSAVDASLVPLGNALLPARSAALYLSEEAYDQLVGQCAAFNAWWQQHTQGSSAQQQQQQAAALLLAEPNVEGGPLASRVAARWLDSSSSSSAVLRIPLPAAMGPHTALACPLVGPSLAQLGSSSPYGRDEFLELAVHLIVEHARGGAEGAGAGAGAGAGGALPPALAAAARPSLWQPYLALLPLPPQLPSPLLHSPQELLALQGSPVLTQALLLRARVAREYGCLRSDLFAAHPEVFGEGAWGAVNSSSSSSSAQLAAPFHYSHFAWAYATLLSRAESVQVEGEEGRSQPLLLPMYDMLPLTLQPPPAEEPVPALSAAPPHPTVTVHLPTTTTTTSSQQPPSRRLAGGLDSNSPVTQHYLASGLVALQHLLHPAHCVDLHLPLPAQLRRHVRGVTLEHTAESLEMFAAALTEEGSGSGSSMSAPCDASAPVLALTPACQSPRQGMPTLAELEYMVLLSVGDATVRECEAAGEEEEGAPGGVLSAGAARLENTAWWWQGLLQGEPLPELRQGQGQAEAQAQAETQAQAPVDLWGIALRELARGIGGSEGAGVGGSCVLCAALEAARLPVEGAASPSPLPPASALSPNTSVVHGFFPPHRLAALQALPSGAALVAQLEELLPYLSLTTGAHVACLGHATPPPPPADAAAAAAAPSAAPSASQQDALLFLQAAYQVTPVGARLLLAGAARARLRAYPTSLATDLTLLLQDSAASVVLALEVEAAALASAGALLGAVLLQEGAAAPAAAACGGYFGCPSLAHLQRSLQGMGEREAQGALLAPRARAALLVVVVEKLLLAEWAGWAPGAEGAEGSAALAAWL